MRHPRSIFALSSEPCAPPSSYWRHALPALLAASAASGASGQTVVGPSPPTITSTVNATAGGATVVGSTLVQTGAANGVSASAGTLLTLTPSAGPVPGPISVQTVGGHAVLANGAGSQVTINGASLLTTGTGSGIAALGDGVVNAANAVISNLGNSTPTVPAGHGVVAESGATINLGAGSSVSTGAFNAVGLGASGTGSRVLLSVPVPVTMNGRGAMGVYLHDVGQVQMPAGSLLQMNASNSVGVAVDNTTVGAGTIGSGLVIRFDAVPLTGQAAGAAVVSFNGASIALDSLHVQGLGAAASAWADAGSRITLTDKARSRTMPIRIRTTTSCKRSIW